MAAAQQALADVDRQADATRAEFDAELDAVASGRKSSLVESEMGLFGDPQLQRIASNAPSQRRYTAKIKVAAGDAGVATAVAACEMIGACFDQNDNMTGLVIEVELGFSGQARRSFAHDVAVGKWDATPASVSEAALAAATQALTGGSAMKTVELRFYWLGAGGDVAHAGCGASLRARVEAARAAARKGAALRISEDEVAGDPHGRQTKVAAAVAVIEDPHGGAVLDLSGCTVVDDDMPMVWELIDQGDALRSVRLQDNALGLKARIELLRWEASANTTIGGSARTVELDELHVIEQAAQAAANEPSVTRLNLTGVGVVENDAAWVYQLLTENTHLTTLELPQNAIGTAIAKALGAGLKLNRTLRTISVRSTGLDDTGCAFLVEGLAANSGTLKKLVADRNTLGLASRVELSRWASAASAVVELDSGEAVDTTLLALAADEGTEELELDSCGLQPADGQLLQRVLAEPAAVVVMLELSSNDLGDAGAIALAGGLKSNTTVEEVRFDSNGITDVGATAIAEVLERGLNGTIRVLTLEDNMIKDTGAEALAKAVSTDRCPLAHLGLSYNHIRQGGAMALESAARSNCTLSKLELAGNHIGIAVRILLLALQRDEPSDHAPAFSVAVQDADTAAEAAQAAQGSAAITSLDLYGSNVTCFDAPFLKALLLESSVLTQLSLSDNDVGDSGAAALGAGLGANATLQLLSVDRNSIGDAGCLALAKGLAANSSLLQLALGGNRISDEGAKAMASALAMADGAVVEQLTLGNNSVGDLGATALLRAIERSHTLDMLRLTDNKIGLAARVALARAASKRGRTLHVDSGEAVHAAAAILDGTKAAGELTELDLQAAVQPGDMELLEEVLWAAPPTLTKLNIHGSELDEGAELRLMRWSKAAPGRIVVL